MTPPAERLIGTWRLESWFRIEDDGTLWRHGRGVPGGDGDRPQLLRALADRGRGDHPRRRAVGLPHWVGSEQIRYFRFEGDRMILRTPPTQRRGSTGFAELTWRRA